MLKRFFISMLYVAYAVALVAVLLVVFFPKDRFVVWVAEHVERKLPGFECRVEDVRYMHPFKIRLDQVRLVNNAKQIDIPIDSLMIHFEMRWPIEHFDVSADLYGGSVASSVITDWKFKTFQLDDFEVRAINLKSVDSLQRSLDRQIKGMLSLSGQIVLKGKNYSDTQFKGVVEIDDFHTKLRRPVLGSTEFDFNKVETGADVNRQRIYLSNGKFSGESLNGNFSGTVNLMKPWQQSRLDIQGGVMPLARLLKSDPKVARAAALLYRQYQEDFIPCLVDGTIKFPQFKFGTNAEPIVN